MKSPSLRLFVIPGVVSIGLMAPSWGLAAPLPDGLGTHGAIAEKNVFDPARKAWPDKSPQAPATGSLTAADVQLYGVMIVGEHKRAIIKLDGKLKHLAPGGNARPFVTLAEGQSIGEYTLAEIQPKQVIFSAGASRQPIAFNLKTDRPAPTPLPPVVQGATTATVEMPTVVPGLTPLAAPAPAPVAMQQPSSSLGTSGGGASSSPSGAASASGSSPSPFANPGASTGGQPAPVIQGATLADAIAAAQAAAANGTLPPLPTINPFTGR